MPVVKETMALCDGVLMERRSSLPPDLSLKSSGSQRGCNLDTQKSIGWLVIGPARPLLQVGGGDILATFNASKTIKLRFASGDDSDP